MRSLEEYKKQQIAPKTIANCGMIKGILKAAVVCGLFIDHSTISKANFRKKIFKTTIIKETKNL